MSMPQANATVTVIAAPGTTLDFDTAAVTGTERWSGSARAYYVENPAFATDGTGADLTGTRRMYVPFEIGELARAGDTATFAIDGQEASTVKIDEVRRYPWRVVRAPAVLLLQAP